MAILRHPISGLFFGLLALLLPVEQKLRSQTIQTDLNLAIAIDCSYSVNSVEFQLQVNGIARALGSEEVVQAIKGGQYGKIGFSVFQWAGPETQELIIPWTIIGSTEDAREVAERLIAEPRRTAEGVTAIGSAITYGVALLQRAPFWSERQVIDMQADGTSTWSRGVPIQTARDMAVYNGVTVNGLPILNEVPYLHHYFRNHVIGGPGSFIEIAENYKAFEKAIKRKLLREIRGLNLS